MCVARRRSAGSERRQPHQPDAQRSRPVSQVVVDAVATSAARPAGRTAEHIGRSRHRQLPTDVDLLAVTAVVRI